MVFLPVHQKNHARLPLFLDARDEPLPRYLEQTLLHYLNHADTAESKGRRYVSNSSRRLRVLNLAVNANPVTGKWRQSCNREVSGISPTTPDATLHLKSR